MRLEDGDWQLIRTALSREHARLKESMGVYQWPEVRMALLGIGDRLLRLRESISDAAPREADAVSMDAPESSGYYLTFPSGKKYRMSLVDLEAGVVCGDGVGGVAVRLRTV
jgi:hypothetical protein